MNTGSVTTGYVVNRNVAATTTFSGAAVLTLAGSVSGSYFWILSANAFDTTNAVLNVSAGKLDLVGAIDRVRLTTVNGTDTFDAGYVSILYE